MCRGLQVWKGMLREDGEHLFLANMEFTVIFRSANNSVIEGLSSATKTRNSTQLIN